jgi:hypothetical protein
MEGRAGGGGGEGGAKLGVERYADSGGGEDGGTVGIDRYADGGGDGVALFRSETLGGEPTAMPPREPPATKAPDAGARLISAPAPGCISPELLSFGVRR